MSVVHVSAQEHDSLRTVTLDDVQLAVVQKNQQQNLTQFFRVNKAATTEDILSRIPELSLVRRGNYGMEPVIRSFNSGQVNLLLDGMRIHGACTDKMDPASIYIEPVNLSGIEVRTAGSSFLNGSSVGGSINMKMAEASCHNDKSFSGSVSSGFHSVSQAFFQSLNLNYSTGKLGLKATGTYRKSGSYRGGKGFTVPFSQYEKVNYSLHAKLLLKNDAYLKFDLLADDGWNIGYAALPMDVGYANARIGAITIVKDKGNNGWQKMEAKLYANKVKHYMDDTHRPNVAMHMDMPGISVTTGLYAQAVKVFPRRSQLTLRADGSVTSLSASMTMYEPGQLPMYMLTWPDNRNLQSGLAAQFLHNIDSSLQLQLNARCEYSDFGITSQLGKDQLSVFGYSGNNNSYFITSTSVQLSKKIMPSIKATLSIGINGRAPTSSELFGFYLFNQFDGFDYLGNTALKQERGRQAEFTLAWKSKKIRIQATGFASQVSDYIIGEHSPSLSAMTIGAKGVKTYRNIPYAWLSGGEGSVIYNPLPQLVIISTLKYVSGKENEGNYLPLISPLRNTSSVRNYFGKLWLQAEYEASASQERVSVAAKERPTGAFSICHFRMGYELSLRQCRLQVNSGVENIFNAYYREHLDWGNVARQGRNIYLQLGLNF